MSIEEVPRVARTQIATADLFDSDPARVSVCDLTFQSHGAIGSAAGPCSTIRVYDHVAVREALSEPGQGRILVVNQIVSGPRVAVLGDRLALLAFENGWAGLVIHGAIRDSDRLKAVSIAIFAITTTARRAANGSAEFERDVRLSFGGANFSPADWVAVDSDAVVSCPQDVVRALRSNSEVFTSATATRR